MTKGLLALLVFAVSALQAWDSNALDAGRGIQLLIVVGVVLPAAVILASTRVGIRLAAAGASIGILAIARMLSGVHMPELMLAGVFPGILILASAIEPEPRKTT